MTSQHEILVDLLDSTMENALAMMSAENQRSYISAMQDVVARRAEALKLRQVSPADRVCDALQDLAYWQCEGDPPPGQDQIQERYGAIIEGHADELALISANELAGCLQQYGVTVERLMAGSKGTA